MILMFCLFSIVVRNLFRTSRGSFGPELTIGEDECTMGLGEGAPILLGVIHTRSSQRFFNLPGPPNFLLSRQNLQPPQSFMRQAWQLLHGIFD